MGLFDFFKKPKSDVEQYYEQRNAREAQERMQGNGNSYTEPNVQQDYYGENFRIEVQDVFTITGRGTVITGQVASGSVRVGDTVTLQRLDGSSREVVVTGLEMFRKLLDTAEAGDNVGILLRRIGRNDIGKGDILTK